MATNLITIYERQYGPFVHMAPNDKAIWTRYLQQGGTEFAPFTYDLNVGDGAAVPAGTDAALTAQWWQLTTKRIDVVAVTPNEIRVIEVKQRAGLSSIGQCLGYAQLYRIRFSPALPVTPWLITDALQPDMSQLLIEQGIQFAEVGY